MSLQQIPNEQSESPPIPPANSQANPKIRIGLHSLPMEILARIYAESMKEEESGTNPGNITRNLPNFIASLKCGVNDPWRRAYIHNLDACSRNWVFSLHFGNDWKLQMDSEEGELVRNIVIKYLPDIWSLKTSRILHHERSGPIHTIDGTSEVNTSAAQPTVIEDQWQYYWDPTPENVNSLLDNLPNVRSIQLEFKTFCVCFESKGLGMCRILQKFLGDHKDFKLKSATIEPMSGTIGPDMPQFGMPQVTVMAGHDVYFDSTYERSWVLKAFSKQTDARAEILKLDFEDYWDLQALAHLRDLVEVLRRCKWTWVFEREEK